MMSKIPIDIGNLSKEELDKELLRAAMIAELDAINLYEQLVAMTDNSKLNTVIVDIIKEEKTHIGEFQALLLEIDKQQKQEIENGRKEVEELTE